MHLETNRKTHIVSPNVWGARIEVWFVSGTLMRQAFELEVWLGLIESVRVPMMEAASTHVLIS